MSALRRLLLISICLCTGMMLKAQTLDFGTGYGVSNARYDRIFGFQASLLFEVGERLQLGPQMGYQYWHYREQYHFHIEGAGGFSVNMQAAASAPFLGFHAEYLVNAPDSRLKCYAGLVLQAPVFLEFVRKDSRGDDFSITPRFGAQLPLTLAYSPESKPALAFFVRALPGYMLPSERHQEANYSFVGSIWSIGGQLGVRYRLGAVSDSN